MACVARELKSLVGWGLPRHCLTRPELRDLIHGRYPGLEDRSLAQMVEKEVQRAAGLLSAGEAQACLTLLRLNHEATNNATINRERAIACLGQAMSVETFRRPDGPEFRLMVKLARALEEPVERSWVVEAVVVSSYPLELRLRLTEH